MFGLVSPGRLLGRLIALGQFEPEWVFDRAVTIVDASRSNPVQIIIVDDLPIVVVKQSGQGIDGFDPIASELAAYRWLEARLPADALAPRLLAAAPGEFLVMDALIGARPLHEILVADPERALAPVNDLATRLAALHLAPPTDAPIRPMPWVAQLHDGPPAPFAHLGGVHEIVEALLVRPEIASAIGDLRERWLVKCMIHGDVKFDNVLVTGFGNDCRSWLIDWELTGGGLPEWDAAGIVEGILTSEIAQDDLPYNSVVTRAAKVTIPAMRTYRERMRGHSPTLHAMINALVVRLAQTVIQIVAMRACGLTQHPVDLVDRLVELASTVATRPEEVAQVLLAEAIMT